MSIHALPVSCVCLCVSVRYIYICAIGVEVGWGGESGWHGGNAEVLERVRVHQDV